MPYRHVVIDGERVSAPLAELYTAIRASGVFFRITEGRRTVARQRELIRQKGLWSPSNPYGAAAVSPDAPHIMRGRWWHACDVVDAHGGNNNGPVIDAAWKLARIRLVRTVSTEAWHLEVHADDRDRLVAWMKGRRRKRSRLRAAIRKLTARLRNLGGKS